MLALCNCIQVFHLSAYTHGSCFWGAVAYGALECWVMTSALKIWDDACWWAYPHASLQAHPMAEIRVRGYEGRRMTERHASPILSRSPSISASRSIPLSHMLPVRDVIFWRSQSWVIWDWVTGGLGLFLLDVYCLLLKGHSYDLFSSVCLVFSCL